METPQDRGRMLNDHADLYQELEDTYMSTFGIRPNHRYLCLTIMAYIRMTDCFNRIVGPSTRLPALRRRYCNLLAVCLRYSFVASVRIPVEFRLRFQYSITGPVPHIQRRQVRIQGRWRTRIEMRPLVRGQVSRAHLEVHLPGMCEREFNNVVRALLAEPRFRGNPGDFPLHDVTRRPGSRRPEL